MFNKFVSISFSIAFGVAPVIMYKQKSIYHRSFSLLSYFIFFNQQSFIQLLTLRTTKALNTLHELIVKVWSPSDSFFKCWSWPWWCTVANLFGNNKEKINKISCIYVCVWVEILEWNTKDYFETLICIWRKRKLPPDKGSTVNTKKHVLVIWKTIASTCIVAWNIWLIRRRI